MFLPSQLTRHNLAQWGGEAVYQQAEKMVRAGAVMQADFENGWIKGTIMRESGPIETSLKILTPDRIDSHCPCYTNQHSGQICAHVVALGITVMMRSTDPLREQKYQEDLRRSRRLMGKLAENALIRRSPAGVPAHLGIQLDANWIDAFRAGKVGLNIMLLTGNDVLPLEYAPRNLAYALNSADDALLSVIEDICADAPTSHQLLSPTDFLNVISLTAHTRLSLPDNRQLTYFRQPVSSSLRVTLNNEIGELTLAPTAQFPAVEFGDFKPIFLASNRDAIAVTPTSIYPLHRETVLPLPYQPLYSAPAVIPRSGVLNFIHSELPNLRKLIPVDTEITEDQFVVDPGKPVFTIDLRGSRASLCAQLLATYGEHVCIATDFTSGSDFADPDPEDIWRYVMRNTAAETNAVARLLSTTRFERDASTTPSTFSLVGERAVLNFLGSGLPALRRAGWRFTLSDKLSEILDSLPFVCPVVKIDKANDRSFEVGYTFELPEGGGTLPATEIQTAINCDNSFIFHGGRTYLVDRDAIHSMREVFSDCHSQDGAAPGHFRLNSIYAPFVQSALTALDGMDIDEPPDWREKAELRNRAGSLSLTPVPLGPLDSTLRPYQKQGVYWLRFMEETGTNGILADEMGLGKTLQTLTWISLKRCEASAQGKPALVVCPTSLVENWAREAEKFTPHLKRLVISGSNREELFKKIPGADLVITSYGLLRRDLPTYGETVFSVAVLDEAQHIKNRTTQSAIVAKQIRAESKLVLTGTPLENSVADLWSIMDFLMPGYLGNYDTFKENYEAPIAGGGTYGETAQDKLQRKLHPFLLRRLKRDVAKDLPPKIVSVRYCPLTDDQRRVYADLLGQSQDLISGMVKKDGFERSRFRILALLMKLRQASCHLDLLNDGHPAGCYRDPSGKLDSFMEILQEAMDGGHRLLVFSQFVKMLTLLRQTLDHEKIPYCYLDGSTKDRLDACQRFNSTRSIPLFLISLKAGGTGLNLTGADMVVHFDPWWNPAVEDQATDRAHRIGQKRTVNSIKLISEDTVEEKVLALQKKKQLVINATLGAPTDESIMNHLTFDDIKSLIGLDID